MTQMYMSHPGLPDADPVKVSDKQFDVWKRAGWKEAPAPEPKKAPTKEKAKPKTESKPKAKTAGKDSKKSSSGG